MSDCFDREDDLCEDLDDDIDIDADIDDDIDHSDEEPWDGFLTDAEADADVLASAGMGTDEAYGFFDDGVFDEY